MRKAVAGCWLGILFGLGTLLGSGEAVAGDTYLDLEPPETLSGYGYGYNSISREHVLKSCVEFGTATQDAGGASGDALQFSSVSTNSQLADLMELSVGAKFSMSMGVASASASAKVGFVESTTTNFMTQTILASWKSVEPIKYIAGDIKLKPEFLKLVGTAAFRQACGDFLIVGMQSGRWFYGTAQLVVKDTATLSKLTASGAAEAQYGLFSTEANVSTLNQMKAASGSKDLNIRVMTSGSKTAAVTIDEFIKQTKSFPAANGPKQIYKLKAVPYENIIANWPQTDPLAPLTAADKLDVIAQAAWGLKSLIDDSKFIVSNPTLFALGTTDPKREARKAFFEKRIATFQAQLDAMRSQAKSCDVDWDGTPACEKLYKQWKTWEDFAVGEYGQFPARYTAECSKAREVKSSTGDPASLLTQAMVPFSQLKHDGKGDREIDGDNTVGIRGYLDFKPNYSGGDKLAVRKLLATLALSIFEQQGDKSSWSTEYKVDVADLDDPTDPLKQCSYAGTGVKAEIVTPSPTTCDAIKTLKGKAADMLFETCKKTLATQKHHGILFSGTSPWDGQGPHTENFVKGASGVITSMTCTVDHADDKFLDKFLGCSNIKLTSVQLDLVNTQDVKADKWVAPGLKLNFKGLKTSASPHSASLRRKKPSPKAQASCTAPLVNHAGQCVPPLKIKIKVKK